MSPKLTEIDVSSDYNWRTTFFSPEKTLFHESIFCFVFLVTSSLDHLIELRFSNLLKWCRKVLCSSAFGVAEHPKTDNRPPLRKRVNYGTYKWMCGRVVKERHMECTVLPAPCFTIFISNLLNAMNADLGHEILSWRPVISRYKYFLPR